MPSRGDTLGFPHPPANHINGGVVHAVGWAASTFSLSVRESRIIEGKAPDSMNLVKFQWRKNTDQIPKECKQQNSGQRVHKQKKSLRRNSKHANAPQR